MSFLPLNVAEFVRFLNCRTQTVSIVDFCVTLSIKKPPFCKVAKLFSTFMHVNILSELSFRS